MTSRILLWHRQDLRMTDHQPLHEACAGLVFPLYCIDDRSFGTTSQGFPKTGAFRAQFLLESLADLRQSYQACGGNLLVRRGKPEEIIPQLVQELEIDQVYFHTYPTTEELAIEAAVVRAAGVPTRSWWGHTLYQLTDLPFEVPDLPDIFTQFRKNVEGNNKQKATRIRPPLPKPTQLNAITATPGNIPTLAELGLTLPPVDDRAVLAFQGGENAGQQRLQHYFWQSDRLQSYKETRNGMVGADYSSKFSPWLALGCLSPRWICSEVQRYEQDRLANDSTYWLIFELLWREYFALIALKHGPRLFQRGGIGGVDLPWKQDHGRFLDWCEGTTGFPLVDANMRELSATGFMSNRGRQNVASFLTKNLGIDWRWGAEWFESLLIDYDPASNWGNWNYTAGIGNDARGFRFFNIYKQSKDYDSQGLYLKLWLPELAALPSDRIHNPSQLSLSEQQQYQVRLGVDYPQPLVDLFKSATANEKIYYAAG